MGGFQIRIPGEDLYSPLHPEDLGSYLSNGDITITEEEIWDKSKGDVLAKSLVLLQVIWFLLQVLARTIQHLAITELEVVTLAFAFLNFMTYFCWWKKPLDINCPIRVSPPNSVGHLVHGNLPFLNNLARREDSDNINSSHDPETTSTDSRRGPDLSGGLSETSSRDENSKLFYAGITYFRTTHHA
ncbi:hypothetical protein C0995_015424 [Termitomyces sp. Mi166|nr:hypothetical protein C0995_015424 [Termitomyces sp. Mi166\